MYCPYIERIILDWILKFVVALRLKREIAFCAHRDQTTTKNMAKNPSNHSPTLLAKAIPPPRAKHLSGYPWTKPQRPRHLHMPIMLGREPLD